VGLGASAPGAEDRGELDDSTCTHVPILAVCVIRSKGCSSQDADSTCGKWKQGPVKGALKGPARVGIGRPPYSPIRVGCGP
jgi:hypothetical protein